MPPEVLLFTDDPSLRSLCEPLGDHFRCISGNATGREKGYTGVAAAIYSFSQLTQGELSPKSLPPVPLLLYCKESQLHLANQSANDNSFFRVVPDTTPPETLLKIINDAVSLSVGFTSSPEGRSNPEPNRGKDGLTGCINRKLGKTLLAGNLKRAQRYAQPLSVIFCDVDGLGEINGAHGYAAGDRVLQDFTAHCRSCLRRDIDMVVRWREDDFLLILPETGIRGAGKTAERLKESFAVLTPGDPAGHVQGSMSFGVSSYEPEYPEHNTTAGRLVLLAQRCFLQAKSAGGNTVLCCP